MDSVKNRLLAWAVATPIVIGLSLQSANGAQYTSMLNMTVGFEHDDNVRLNEGDEESISGYTLLPEFRLAYETKTFNASLGGKFVFAEFDEEQYNSEDQRLVFRLDKITQVSEFNFEAGINRDSTRTSEILDTGLISEESVRREDAWLSPGWEYRFNQRHSMELIAYARTVDYKTADYADYDYLQLEGSWIYALNLKTNFRAQLLTGDFETDESQPVESDVDSFKIGADSLLTKNLEFEALLGIADVETDYNLVGTSPFDDEVFVFETSLVYTQPSYLVSLEVAKELSPSGNGYLQQSERAELRYKYDLSERSNLQLRTLVGRRESPDNRIDDEREYTDSYISWTYRMFPSWYLSTRYRYRTQDRERIDSSAESNAVFLAVEYRPGLKRWSR